MRRLLGYIIGAIGKLHLPMGLRLMRGLSYIAPGRRIDLVCTEFDGRQVRYRTAMDTPLGNTVAFGKSLEPEIVRLASSLVDKTAVVIDVGCNVGTFAIPLANYVDRIIAIDALHEAVEEAKTNAALNAVDNIEFLTFAAGEAAGTGVLTVAVGWNVLSSLSEEWVAQSTPNPTSQRAVPILPLSVMVSSMGLDNIDLIKIDVENFSGSVIRGLHESITRVRHILAEDSTDLAGVIPWLRENGFSCSQPLRGDSKLPSHTANTWLFSRGTGAY